MAKLKDSPTAIGPPHPDTEFFYARIAFDERLVLGGRERELTFYVYGKNRDEALSKMDAIEAAVRAELDAVFSGWEDSIMEHYKEKSGEQER